MKHHAHSVSPSQRMLDNHVPTILLIDDDPDITQTIQLRLANYDVNLIRRFTGMQGINEATLCKPDLIITDLRMPHGEGEDVLTCVKRNESTAHIPVIVLSGQTHAGLPNRMLRMGAAAFLKKPIHYLELLGEISRHVTLKDLDWVTCTSKGLECG